MKTRIVKIAAVLAATLVPTFAAAQNNGGGYNESVVVKGTYRPEIENSRKLTFPAVITDTLARIEHQFNYSITPTRLKALYEPSRIKAARIVGEPATKLYNNYIRLGVGDYWSPLADLYWSSTRDMKKTYGVRVNHLSSWGSISNYGRNHFGNTGVTLFGKYIVADKLQLSSDVSYEHDHNLYYGFHDTTLASVMPTFTRDSFGLADYRISYNVATWNIGLRNMELDPYKLGYSLGIHASDMWATWHQNELNLNINGDVHYGFDMMRKYRGVAYLRFEWDAYANRVQADTVMPLGYIPVPVADTVRGYRNIVKANPYIDFMFSGLQFHAGLTAGWDAFTASGTTFRLFPDVVVSKSLMNEALVLSLGATGGFDANSWNRTRLVNPYLAPGSEMKATRHYDFALYGRWNISRKLEANAEVSFTMLQDDLSFTLDDNYSLHNVYKPMYVDDNRLTLGGTVAFVNDEMLTLSAGGHYYHYTYVSDTALAKPLYRPDWDAIVAAKVNYHDKWLFYLEGQLLGSMTGDEGQTMPLRYGVAAEVEYRHNRALSFFLRMDNLAFQRYYLWANYPSRRGLFLAGLTYTIPHK